MSPKFDLIKRPLLNATRLVMVYDPDKDALINS